MNLAEAGQPELIRILPLSLNERSWWQGLGSARSGDLEPATQHLRELAAAGYADAAFVLRFAERRTARSTPTVEVLVRSSGDAIAARDHVAMAIKSGNSSPPGQAGPYRRVLEALAGGPVAEPLRLPSSLPPSVVDDLVDRGVPITIEDGRERGDTYLRARVLPGTLSDDEIVELDFQTEKARRLLIAGADVSDVDPASLAAPFADRVRMLTSGVLSDALRSATGPKAKELASFLSRPSWSTLSAGCLEDPTLWPYIDRLVEGTTPGDIVTPSVLAEFAAWREARHALDRLLQADWTGACLHAREALRYSRQEALRDEALNLLACGQWQLGNDEAALQALKSAVEGSRNASLQVNLGVVAAQLDREAAALELARLVRESPSLELRCAAGLRAASLWMSDELPWESDTEGGLPEPIRDALRGLVVQDIPIETFRTIIRLQANLDDEWLADEFDPDASSHGSTPEAQVYVAKATGPRELAAALTPVLKAHDAPQWARDERDALIRAITKGAIDDPASSIALFAFSMIEEGLPVEPRQQVLIAPLAIHSVCSIIDPSEGEPAQRFDQLLRESEALIEDGNAELKGLYDDAWDRLIFARALHLAHSVDEIGDAYNSGHRHIAGVPRRRLNMTAVRSAFGPLADAVARIDQRLSSLPIHRATPETRELIHEVRTHAAKLRGLIREVMS